MKAHISFTSCITAATAQVDIKEVLYAKVATYILNGIAKSGYNSLDATWVPQIQYVSKKLSKPVLPLSQ